MIYQAIISDFDGTLTGHDGSIRPRVIEAINTIVKKGVKFTIATGRMYQGMLAEQTQNITLQNPIIVRGGAEIYDPVQNKIIWSKCIDKTVAAQVIQFLQAHEMPVSVDFEDKIFSTVSDQKMILRHSVKLTPLAQWPHMDAPKVWTGGLYPRSHIEQIQKELQETFPGLEITLTGTAPYVALDINAKGVTKHLAVLEWEKMMNIPRSTIIGVGDSYNDYGLLSACGLKVAMGNAREELKAMADWIAPSLDEDGVAVMIEKFCS